MRQMLRELAISVVIVAICVIIHCAVLILFFEWLLTQRPTIEQKYRIQHHSLLLILAFTIMIFLHVTETAIWAAFYYWRGLFEDFETSLYFSMGSYTTIGYGDVVLPRTWRLLGAIEGISGVLLCGLSAAFVFAIVN